ncbi:MAG: hypothetical protein ACLGIN_16745 [Candidatus Sericytochromatia bacterium]
MQLIGAALVGMMRAVVPPQAAPEADITVSKTAATNMSLDLECRRLLSPTAQQRLAQIRLEQTAEVEDPSEAQAARKAQQPSPTEQVQRLERAAPADQVAEVLEASRIARADRPHRVSRPEGLNPTDMGSQEVQLIQAHYRDQAFFSSAAREILLARQLEA